MDELSSILWASCTTPKTGLGELLFNLAFGTEAILSLEIVFLIPLVESFEKGAFKKELRAKLDLFSNVKVEVHLQDIKYKRIVVKLYDHGVRL